ncbi:MAG: CMP/dCMP kinase [Eubacteriales bacterium]|nr:CMP/dCMP kinase [Eubacteriales bacterium]
MARGIVAIDGPAGAGKSTVARQVADRLGYLYIDTGAMYRALTWKALMLGVNLEDENALTALAANTDVALTGSGEGQRVYVDGREVTEEIRRPEVSRAVSLVARVPGVREEMMCLQRQLAAGGRVVLDGRDIGTCVLPCADCKIFLTASPEERARRRWLELKGKGYEVSFEQILAEIKERDRIDSQREVAPLKPAEDAVVIDTTGMTLPEVVEKVIRLCRDKGCEPVERRGDGS